MATISMGGSTLKSFVKPLVRLVVLTESHCVPDKLRPRAPPSPPYWDVLEILQGLAWEEAYQRDPKFAPTVRFRSTSSRLACLISALVRVPTSWRYSSTTRIITSPLPSMQEIVWRIVPSEAMPKAPISARGFLYFRPLLNGRIGVDTGFACSKTLEARLTRRCSLIWLELQLGHCGS